MNAAAIVPGNNGVRVPNGTRIGDTRHASAGGRPYPKETREMVIQMWTDAVGNHGGLTALRTPQLDALRANRKFPHLDTCKRWIRIHNTEGHVRPKRHTGNNHSEREVQGVDLDNLALFRMVRPKAYLDEVRAYVHNRNPVNRPYSRSQICRAENKLGLWLKVASTTSGEAYRPANINKRDRYWGEAYPGGVNDQNTESMIDIDEAGFKLESKDRKRGKVTKQRRADARGKYKKGARGVSLLMGISGDQQDPFEFHQLFSEGGGTDLWRFFRYMEDFIAWLDVNRPNQTFCFTMDNLNIHKHPVILDLIEDAGHRLVFRAPYWSCDGAIEYVFNTIHVKLQMNDGGVTSVDDLINEIDDIIFEMVDSSFYPYFQHVGFP
ncbi:hypothetical protein ACHAXR_001422 [Thalassiosira sp. AJA248-18]